MRRCMPLPPILFQVIDARLGAEMFEQAERARARRELTDRTVVSFEIAERDRIGRTRRRACRQALALGIGDLAAGEPRLFLELAHPVVTERALLDDALG